MRVQDILTIAVLPALVAASVSTDSLQDVDPPQSGYLPKHNMDPTSKFSSSWTKLFNTNEVFYAKPLVWTPKGATSEQVILVSNMNIIRIVDGLTGNPVNSRTLKPPFQTIDSNCNDVPNFMGIIGTPYIDSATDIMYLYSKSYKGGVVGPAGTINGQYDFYAIQLPGLTDIPQFPVTLEGHHANNDATRYFIGGTLLQRPSLASIGNNIIAGFGGECDNFNYTGYLVSASKTSGVGVTNIIAMEASPGAPSPQALDILVQGGGKAGIWQGGMGIAADGNRVYFVTGNGRGGGANAGGQPASGKVPISTLAQAAVNFGVSPSGVLTQQDYFEPFEYNSLNGGDRDFGSSGIALLDPAVFSGGGVTQVAVAGGKSGKLYFLDANNLGGFANGPGGLDAVLQTIVQPNSFFGGAASYPLEGGYVYFVPTGDSIYAYKLSLTSGKPQFVFAGKTAQIFAGRASPTVTSLNGQPGTGIVWLADINTGLVAYHAVPVGGVLVPITIPSTGRLTKYQRPVFGNGRVYVSNGQSVIAVAGAGGPATTILPSTTTSTSTSTSSVPSTISATTTQTTLTTSTVTGTGGGPTPAYTSVGCFGDTSTGHALKLLFANSSVTPELCIAYAQQLARAPIPTVLPYVYVEYHRECFGGSSFAYGASQVSSLTGAHACTDICSGSIGAAVTGTAMCGGPNQYNLYATGAVNFPNPPLVTRSV